MAERLALSLLLASVVAYAATPLAIVLANRLEFYDRPSGYKAHGRPTPYLGGAAVMAGFIVAVLVAGGEWHKSAPLVSGVAVLWAVGTVDDRRTVPPMVRVAVELGLAYVVWSAGLGWEMHMGNGLNLTLTCLWLVGVINAFNLFDNMDGAAGTMALAVSIGAAILGVVQGDTWLAVGAASLGGACLGFLPRNLALPARIFLGDGGSMPIGFTAAVLVMAAATSSTSTWKALPIALLLVGLPALDTTLVVVSRRRRGVPVLSGGKDHLTHRTRRFMPSARAVALGLGGLQAVVSIVAVMAAQGGASFVVIAAVLYTLAVLCAIAALEGHSVPIPERSAGESELDRSHWVPESPLTVGRSTSRLARASARGLTTMACVLLAVLGLGAGLSPFFFAYYDPTVWAPVGLGVVTLCAVAVVARPFVPGGPAALAIAGLFGLGIWSLCSGGWSESVDGATLAGDRLLAYGAMLVLMLAIVRSERRAGLVLGAAGVGVAAVALSVLVRMLGHDPSALFLRGRLNEPLGYINGEGCLFAMGFWLCMAAVESRRVVLAGAGAALATLMASLALLTQSRGTALAMLVALISAIALLPGRRRRTYALLLLGGCMGLVAPVLLDVYSSAAGGTVPVDAGHRAGEAAVIAALTAGLAWGALTAVWEAIRLRGVSPRRLRTVGTWALTVPAVAALAAATASGRSIEREASAQWRAFTHLTSPATGGQDASAQSRSRLLSGAGDRYDYWHIAWRLWREHPVVGVGGGGYASAYYQRRATTEDIDQPHSIELQILSELGLIGGLMLLAFVGAVGWAAMRMGRAARASTLARASAVAATGAFSVWLAQASVDWMHLLPGVTAIALVAGAALLWPRWRGVGARLATPETRASGAWANSRCAMVTPIRSRRLPHAVGASAVLITLIVAGASLSRQALSQLYAQRAQRELGTRPEAALSDAQRSLDLDSDAVKTYYIKAAALARFDQAAGAEATLRQALGHEPNNFVTWTLIGDIALRQSRLSLARHDYRHAHVLNPRNATLATLAANPRAALR